MYLSYLSYRYTFVITPRPYKEHPPILYKAPSKIIMQRLFSTCFKQLNKFPALRSTTLTMSTAATPTLESKYAQLPKVKHSNQYLDVVCIFYVPYHSYDCTPPPSHSSQVELHVHLDGACRLSTLQDLARQFQLPYPYDNLEEFKKCVALPSAASSLVGFLEVFTALGEILRYVWYLQWIGISWPTRLFLSCTLHCEWDHMLTHITYLALLDKPKQPHIQHLEGNFYTESNTTGETLIVLSMYIIIPSNASKLLACLLLLAEHRVFVL